ncbi:hypothetical protein [Microvirga sp. M2]|uniref:hypothetical protein n=1 Tax=Microvirga sp. M2 TaxID=3073270 RepID=UPI0039C0C581
MNAKFQVGQIVQPAHPRRARPDTYRVVQVLCENSHEPQYRIWGLSCGAEVVVLETQIQSA